MFSILPNPRPPLTNLLLIIIPMAAAAMFYTYTEHAPPPLVELGIVFAPAVAVAMWFKKYLRLMHFDVPFDFGYFIMIGWPILIPIIAKRMHIPHPWRLAFALYALALASAFAAFVGVLAS